MLQSDMTEAFHDDLLLDAGQHAGLGNDAEAPTPAAKASTRSRRAVPRRSLQNQLSDDDLIKRVAGRDAAAMDILYVRYRAKVFNYVHRLVHERDDVNDLVSQAFLDVWHAADTFEHRSSVSTWILAIARFKALRHFRQRKRERIDDVEIPEMIDDAESPEKLIDRTRMNNMLRACVLRLDPARRRVVDLVYYQDRSVIEASEILGIPCATVKTRMFYARKDLAMLLKGVNFDRTMPP